MDVRVVSTDPQVWSLAAFNAASPEAAQRDMLACCASGSFARMMVGGRPYRDPAALADAVSAAFKALTWDDIIESLNAHPRIGDRVAEDIVWSYPAPVPENPRIAGLMCFRNERVDLTVDGQRLKRPVTPWS